MIYQDLEFTADTHCLENFEFIGDARLFERGDTNLRLILTSLLDKVRSHDKEGIFFVVRFPS